MELLKLFKIFCRDMWIFIVVWWVFWWSISNVIISHQKFPKVKHHYAFILHRISFKPFLNDAKLLKCLYKYFFWANTLDVCSFICKKTRRAGLGANIFQIFSQLGSAKIFGLLFRGLCSTGPLNWFNTFPQPGWIATDS